MVDQFTSSLLAFSFAASSAVFSGQRGESVRLSPAARETLRAILTAPLDPASTLAALKEISAVTRMARRHFLGHELKSQRVWEETLR